VIIMEFSFLLHDGICARFFLPSWLRLVAVAVTHRKEERRKASAHRMETMPTRMKTGLDHAAISGDKVAANCALYQVKGFTPSGALSRKAWRSGE
jgi:hypothetical protein